MSDYSFNRITLDILELLQDLKSQGMYYFFRIAGNGSIDISLFFDEESYNNWCDIPDGLGKRLASFYISDDDIVLAGMCFNELLTYKFKSEVEL